MENKAGKEAVRKFRDHLSHAMYGLERCSGGIVEQRGWFMMPPPTQAASDGDEDERTLRRPSRVREASREY